MDPLKIVGKYHMVRQKNFDQFLKAVGVSAEKRAIAAKASSHVECKYNADTEEWFVHIKGLRETDFKFKLDVPSLPRVTDDGRTVTDSFYVEGNKLIQTEKWEGGAFTTTFVHEISDDHWIMTVSHGGVKCVRHYKRDSN